MLEAFYIQTPAGRVHYEPFIAVGTKMRWLKSTDNPSDPIESRLVRMNASRREIIAAFND